MPLKTPPIEQLNRAMIAFVLGTSALLAPGAVMRVMGHEPPSEDAQDMLRRSGPVWITFAVAHAVAATRGEPSDWKSLAWLRGTEIATDVLWSRSPRFNKAGKAMLWAAGAANLAMTVAFGLESRRRSASL